MKRIEGMDTQELIAKVVDGELASAVETACREAVFEKLKEPGVKEAIKRVVEAKVAKIVSESIT